MRIVEGETCIDASADPRFLDMIPGLVAEARAAVEERIASDPGFGSSLSPIPPSADDHPLIERMCAASVSADVGPMAAVAGAIAGYVLENLTDAGCARCIIDNGGDIAMIADIPVTVGLFTGRAETSGLCLRIPPRGCPTGICSSSGTVGHSLSFGRADIAAVMSPDAALADACATSLANGISCEEDLERETERVCAIPGVAGCLAAVGDRIAACGDIPDPEMMPPRSRSPIGSFRSEPWVRPDRDWRRASPEASC